MEPEIEVGKRTCAKPERRELVWLIDVSVKLCEYQLGRFFEIFTGSDGVLRSPRVKLAHGELNRPVVKLVPVFYDGISEIENRAGLAPLQIHYKSHQTLANNV